MKESTRVLIALVAGIGGGIAIGASGIAPLQTAADAIAPIGSVWVNAIRMTVIPLVVSLLIVAVASAADVRAIGRIGGRALFVFFSLLIATAAVVIPILAALYNLLPTNSGAAPVLPAGASEAASQLVAPGQAQTAAAWLVSLVPSNPIAAAANGAMLPLIVFSLLFALAIANLESNLRSTLVGFFRAIADAMLLLVQWVVLLAPIGVFALVLPLATHAGAQLAGAIGVYIVAYSVACIVTIALLHIPVAIFGGVSVTQFARAILPAQLIALSSSSSIAALPALVVSAEKLNLPKSATGFVLPLSVSTFKVAGPVAWTVGALLIAWLYGVPLHARELATIGLASCFLTFGAPGVPRGAFIMLAPLFQAIGLPIEGIGILIAVDAVPDTFSTALNVTGYLSSTVIVARPDTATAAGPDTA